MKYAIIFIAGLALVGCRSIDASASAIKVTTQPRTAMAVLRSAPMASAHDVDLLIAAHGSVTFRSCDGRYMGADADSDLTLYPAGRAHMTDYSFAVTEYRGTYSINDHGIVKAVFPGFSEPWPVLELHRDKSSLFLIPVGDTDYISGESIAPRWIFPFRPITSEEEKKNPPTPDNGQK